MISFTDFFFFRVLSILRLIDIVTLFFFCSYFSPVPPRAHIAAKVERERSPPSRHTLTEIHSLIQWTHTQVLCWSVGVLVCVCLLVTFLGRASRDWAGGFCLRTGSGVPVCRSPLSFIYFLFFTPSFNLYNRWMDFSKVSLSLSLSSFRVGEE